MQSVNEMLQKQYTVNSSNKNSLNSKQYTVSGVRNFVESLDKRVYCNQKFLPFYCKAAKKLGFPKMLELQRIAVDPSVDHNERMFMWLIKEEFKAKGIA